MAHCLDTPVAKVLELWDALMGVIEDDAPTHCGLREGAIQNHLEDKREAVLCLTHSGCVHGSGPVHGRPRG